MKALLVGGTGPTGPHLANGLVERGYELTLFNRGLHSAPNLPEHQHIRADPHFRETIDEALAGKEFDVVVATYGRIRHLAEALSGRCRQFISVGGTPAYLGMLAPEKCRPFGARVPAREDEGLATEKFGEDEPSARFSNMIWDTEQKIMAVAGKGGFSATHFRYPRIYGPRQPSPPEWAIVKRVLDGRKHMILPDGGLEIQPRCAAINAAHSVLLAIDKPAQADAQIFNCADDDQFTWRQIVEIIVDIVGGDMQVYSMPERLAKPARALSPLQNVPSHCLLDTSKIRALLGYKDVIPAREALLESIQWLLSNPIADDQFSRDPFNYAAEDRLIAAYEKAIEEIERVAPFELPEASHLYAHPKKPGLELDHKGR